MKRCEEVVPLLGPLLDAALPDDDREWVEEHVKGCAACRDRQALIGAQGAALREVFAAKPADFAGFADKVMARVQAGERPAPFSVWGREMWGAHHRAFTAVGGFAVAACMALAVLFVQPAAPPDEGALLADASGPQVEQVDFGTHDGAVLQLPHDTTVIWMSEDVN
ncbi:MAG: anti-sigma factor family protein [Myxococcales bacterium]